MIQWIKACSNLQAEKYNNDNDKIAISNLKRKQIISKIKWRDYSWCKITKIS